MRLICDTSVWYKLIEKKEWIHRLKNYELVSTLNSFFEILTCPNFLRVHKGEKSIKALDLMCKNSNFIPKNPWEYITEDDNLHNKWVVDAFHSIKFFTTKSNLSDINFNIEPGSTLVMDRKQALQIESDSFNAMIETIKQNPVLNPGKKEIVKLRDSYKDIIINCIINAAKAFYKTDQINSINWLDKKFFLNMYTNYIILLVKSQQKQKPNDILDLYNMIYVKPEDKYLTNDKKTWLNISKQNSYTNERFLYLEDFKNEY